MLEHKKVYQVPSTPPEFKRNTSGLHTPGFVKDANKSAPHSKIRRVHLFSAYMDCRCRITCIRNLDLCKIYERKEKKTKIITKSEDKKREIVSERCVVHHETMDECDSY